LGFDRSTSDGHIFFAVAVVFVLFFLRMSSGIHIGRRRGEDDADGGDVCRGSYFVSPSDEAKEEEEASSAVVVCRHRRRCCAVLAAAVPPSLPLSSLQRPLSLLSVPPLSSPPPSRRRRRQPQPAAAAATRTASLPSGTAAAAADDDDDVCGGFAATTCYNCGGNRRRRRRTATASSSSLLLQPIVVVLLLLLLAAAAAAAAPFGRRTWPGVPLLQRPGGGANGIAEFARRRRRRQLPPTATVTTTAATVAGASSLLRRFRGGGGATTASAASKRQKFQPKMRTKNKAEPQVDRPSSTAAAVAAAAADDRPGKEDPRIMRWVRLLFLTYYGSLGSLLPYLPVYYHSLGHGGQIIGLLGAVKPFTTFLVAPLWGIIADQTQNPFLILQVTFLVSLLGQLLVSMRHDAWYLSFMVFLTALFNAPVKSLIDSMVMDHIHDQTSYGRLRLWGQMGFGLGSSAVGVLLSRSQHIPWPETTTFSEEFQEMIEQWPPMVRTLLEFADKCWTSMTAYKLLFFAHAALSVPTWMCIRAFKRLDKEQKDKAEKKKMTLLQQAGVAKKSAKNGGGSRIAEGLLLMLHSGDALLFFFLVFVVGVSSGVIENFAYVRMREVGGTGKDMGLSRLVSSIAGAPMFWFSGPLTRALGADRVIVLSLLSYVTRFLIYAFMRNPHHGLPAEALRGVTFAAFWSTCTIYAHRVSPPGLHATMLMFLNAMYGGLGQSLGAIIGGKLQHRVGTVRTFLYSAAVDLCFVCIVIVYLSIRQDSSFKDPKPIVAQPKKHGSKIVVDGEKR